MLNSTELIGFGSGGDPIPSLSYINAWQITYPTTTTTINNVSLLPGTKTLVFGIMQHDNDGRYRYTTNVTVNGVSATQRVTATNTQEYNAEMSFWEISTASDLVNIVVSNNGGGSHGAGAVHLWMVPTPLGAPTDTQVCIYTSTSGTIDKYKDGVVLALANGFSGTPWISGIPNNGPIVWVNRPAHEVPTSTVAAVPISYGPVTQYYNQMMLAVSWLRTL